METANDSNEMFNQLHGTITTHCSTTYPTTRKKYRKAEGKPWIMPWLQEPCDRKNSLYSNFVKTPTTENKDIYTKMKKWVDKQIFTEKKRCYVEWTNLNVNFKC